MLIEQLNCLCDGWAKGARHKGIISPRDTSDQVLPQERDAVFINGVKQTCDLAHVARFELRLIEAHCFIARSYAGMKTLLTGWIGCLLILLCPKSPRFTRFGWQSKPPPSVAPNS